MRIAVFIDQNIESGGAFSYSLEIALSLNRMQSSPHTFVFVTPTREILRSLSRFGINLVLFEPGFFWRMLKKATVGTLSPAFLRLFTQTALDRFMNRQGIDLVYFLNPSTWALMLRCTNYIFTVWDLCHRDHPEFPEVRKNGEFEKREWVYRSVLPMAVSILADSEHGKAHLIHRYGLDSDRIRSIPFFISSFQQSAPTVDVREKYRIPGDYIFYPAQIWPHKNHVYIIEALALLKNSHNRILYAVFSGADKGNLCYLKDYAHRVGVSDLIRFVGFVDRDDVPSLYNQSRALVMPTYFGPTNIPPLEAFSSETPVFYSDLEGLRDQVQSAAVLINLQDPADLAEKLASLLRGELPLEGMTAKGLTLLNSHGEAHFWRELMSLLALYQSKMKCWENKR